MKRSTLAVCLLLVLAACGPAAEAEMEPTADPFYCPPGQLFDGVGFDCVDQDSVDWTDVPEGCAVVCAGGHLGDCGVVCPEPTPFEPTGTFTPTPAPEAQLTTAVLPAAAAAASSLGGPSCPYEAYSPACAEDDTLIDGYWWNGIWSPGYPRVASQFMDLPLLQTGRAVWYAPGVMRATAEQRGLSLHGYLDGAASMSCADVGLPMWVNRGYGWEGPFLVVDCPQLDDLWGIIVGREEVFEVGWDTARRWAGGENPPPGGWDVMVSRVPPSRRLGASQIEPQILSEWWAERVEFYPRALTVELDNRPIYRSPSTWRLGGEWVTFSAP